GCREASHPPRRRADSGQCGRGDRAGAPVRRRRRRRCRVVARRKRSDKGRRVHYRSQERQGHLMMRFGPFGGRYVAETLIPALDELDAAWRTAWADEKFHAEFDGLLKDYVGRPSPLTCAESLTRELGG